ncbi:MAG: hypothetical protein IT210_13115, partial [Armatimonadetes bacterium]|nr:hypothetical protein [Armatimonadota bacterium]
MDSTMITCALFIAGLLFTGASFTQADQVPLTLRETAGAARRQEPVTCGIPLPRGAVTDAGQFRLIRESDGKEVPAQFRIAGQWWPDPSVRWVWVDFQADLPAKASAGYRLEYGPGIKAEALPEQPVAVTEQEARWVVDTGAARFTVSKTRFDLFESVEIGGDIQAARRGKIHIEGIGRSATRAAPDPANRGSAHLIYAEAGENALAEEWTLTFTDDAGRFEAIGSKTGTDGSGIGRWGAAFRSKSGRLILNDDAWLVDRQPRQGDRFTFATVPEGGEIAEGFVTESRWLERGSMKCVLEQKGSLGLERAGLLEFTARYAFYAGSGQVHLSFTLENNDHSGRTETGNVRNADIGTPNTVFFEEMALSLPVAFAGPVRYRALGEADTRPLTGSLEKEITIYQDSSGTEKWNRYMDAQFHPRPNSYVSFRGYRITRGQDTLEEGRQAAGWLEIAGAQGRAGMTLRDFGPNFPKALNAAPSGDLTVALFPGQYAGPFALRPGEHKTHDLLLDFSAGQETGPALARSFSAPLLLEPAPEWWAKTEVLGPLHPYDPERYPAYEARNLSAIGVYPPGAEPGPSLFSRIEEFDFYGWMDYGDVPIDFESGTGQWNLKYDFDFGMLKQYARTGQRGWLNLFRAAARHMGDIDVFHAPHYPEPHFLKGGVYAHSLHDEPGHRNPNRNYNHFTRDLAFGARGTAALYYLAGDWKAREACLAIAENAMAPYMSPQSEPEDSDYYPPGSRSTANTLNRLLEAYQLTGEDRYLQRIRWCVKESAFDGRIPPDSPLRVDVWSMTFHALALARYLELFPDDALARKTFLAHADLMVKSADPTGQKGA